MFCQISSLISLNGSFCKAGRESGHLFEVDCVVKSKGLENPISFCECYSICNCRAKWLLKVFFIPVSGIIVIFLQGENRLSPMWFHHHLKWSLLCVWFSPTVYGEAFFCSIAVIGSWGKKKCCENYSLASCLVN